MRLNPLQQPANHEHGGMSLPPFGLVYVRVRAKVAEERERPASQFVAGDASDLSFHPAGQSERAARGGMIAACGLDLEDQMTEGNAMTIADAGQEQP